MQPAGNLARVRPANRGASPGLHGPDGTGIVREPLQPGRAGLRQSVAHILNRIRAAGKDLQVRRLAVNIVRNVAPGDFSGEIKAIFDWSVSLQAPPYRLDPVDVELIRGCMAAVNSNGIDCDDSDVMCGGLLESIGHPVDVVTVDMNVGREGPAVHHHTKLAVYDRSKGAQVPFDPVLRLRDPRATVGDQPAFKEQIRWSSVERFSDSIEDDGEDDGDGLGAFTVPPSGRVAASGPNVSTSRAAPMRVRRLVVSAPNRPTARAVPAQGPASGPKLLNIGRRMRLPYVPQGLTPWTAPTTGPLASPTAGTFAPQLALGPTGGRIASQILPPPIATLAQPPASSSGGPSGPVDTYAGPAPDLTTIATPSTPNPAGTASGTSGASGASGATAISSGAKWAIGLGIAGAAGLVGALILRTHTNA
jgi:hypothetical protein